MIIYIHGYKSNGNSEKARLLRKHFGDENVYSPTLTGTPKQSLGFLTDYIVANRDKNLMIVGSSLGGFIALNLLQTMNLKAVLINPSLTPLKNLGDKEDLEFTDALRQMELPEVIGNLSYAHTFLAKDDDVVLPFEAMERLKTSRKLTVTETGGHRFTEFEKYMDDVKNLYEM